MGMGSSSDVLDTDTFIRMSSEEFVNVVNRNDSCASQVCWHQPKHVAVCCCLLFFPSLID
jgi:hypothetical protein